MLWCVRHEVHQSAGRLLLTRGRAGREHRDELRQSAAREDRILRVARMEREVHQRARRLLDIALQGGDELAYAVLRHNDRAIVLAEREEEEGGRRARRNAIRDGRLP